MDDVKIEEIIKEIARASSVAVISHINMDGDAIGSSLAIMLALRKLGKRAFTYVEEEIPDRFKILEDFGKVIMYDGGFVEAHDLLVVVDVADRKMLGKRAEMLSSLPKSVSIDHHFLNCDYADVSYVQSDAAAAGELVYDIIKRMGINLDFAIATCIYVAIATDTGRFKFDSTTPKTHVVASDLLTYGVDSNWIANKVFDETSKERTFLIADAIHTLETYCDDRIAIMSITRDMIEKVGAKDSDAEGIIDFAMNIREVEIAVVIREKVDGTVKASLRSKASVNVAQIASKFGGGGHVKAAGLTTNKGMNEIKKELVNCIKGEM